MKFLLIVSTVLIVSIAAQGPPSMKSECEQNLATTPESCCKSIPEFFEQKIIDKCRADFNKDGTPTPCFAECLTNATSILKAGQFQNDQAFKIMSASANPTWKPVIKRAIETCINEFKQIKAAMPQQQPSNPQKDICSLVSGAMIVCIRTNAFLECPNYSATDDCKTLKTQIPNCPIALIKRVR